MFLSMMIRRFSTAARLAAAMAAVGAMVAPVEAQAPRTTRVAYPTGNESTSVILLERIHPSEVRVGASFEYVIKLTNLTSGQVEHVVLEEKLPGGFDLQNVDPNPESQTDVVRWDLGTFGPRASKSVRLAGSAGATGELPSCATVTFKTEICSSVRVVQPALELVKTLPDEVMICDRIPLALTVTNTGTGVARKVRVADDLPEGLTTLDGKSRLAFDAGDLGAGQSREFAVELRAERTGEMVNEATVTEEGGLTATAGDRVRITQPNLTLTKSGPDRRFLGRPATFELTVRNDGDAPARDAVLTDALPSGTTFREADQGGRQMPGQVVWDLGTLDPGASRTVSVTLIPNQKGAVRNTARVTAYCAEAEASWEMEVEGIPAVLLEVIDIDDPIEVGANETYEITVYNQGSAQDTDIVIACELPPEQRFVDAKGPTNARVDGANVTFEPLPMLAPKAKATYRVVVKGVGEGDVRFKVTLTSDQLTTPVQETESTHVYQ